MMSGGTDDVPEEELFGDVVTSDSSGWWAFLAPAGNLPTGATDSVWVAFGDHNTPRDWGWYDVSATDGGCQPTGVASSAERHVLPNGKLAHDSVVGTDTLETHCVDSGTWFRLDLVKSGTLQFRRPIDWVDWNRVIVDGVVAVYIDNKYGGVGGYYIDVVADFNSGATDTVFPVLEITATQSPLVASWDTLEVHADGKYHIPGNFYVRVSASETTESSPTKSPEIVLVRYFWEYGHNTNGTRFVSVPGERPDPAARTYKYGSQASAYDRTLFAHFVMPQHTPSPVSDTMSTNYGDSLKLNLRIHTSFTADILSDADTVVTGDSIHFSDIGANGGGTKSRFWTFEVGGDTVTAATPGYVYTTAGTKTVVLKKTNDYHDLLYLDTTTVVVLAPLDAGVIVGSYDGWPTNNDIEENGDCMWEVTPTGGTGSYTYVWQRQKRFWATITGETTQELYLADVGTSDFGLRTIISSGPLTDTTAALSMTVSPKGQVCIIRK